MTYKPRSRSQMPAINRRSALGLLGGVACLPVLTHRALSAAPAFTFKLGFENSQDHFLGVALQNVSDAVARHTDGQVNIRLFPNSQLGASDVLVKGMRLGSVDMAAVASDQMEIVEPMMGISALPFSVKDFEQAHRIEDGPVAAEAARRLEEKSGIHVLGYLDNGFRYTMTRSRVINSVDDFRGLKIRIPNVPTYRQAFELVGANPVVVAFAEIYTALQSNLVDGMEGAPAALQTSKFYEVGKYLAATRHIFVSVPVSISARAWKSLPADLQRGVQAGFNEALKMHRENGSEQADGAALKFLSTHGLTLNDLDTKPIQAKMRPVYDTFAKEIGGGDWIERMVAQ